MKFAILFITFLSFIGRSQTISGSEQERIQLEELVKQKIDSVRVKHKRLSLSQDEILYKAAAHHSEYIKAKGKLSHTETTKDLKTPQDRANYYGATNLLVGENVLFSDYNIRITTNKGKKYTPKNIETLANVIVQLWIESPDHYKNLLTKEYELTAVAVSFDLKNSRVYVTQLFAYVEQTFED